MSNLGAKGFWVYLLVLMTVLVAYVAYRMTQRQSLYAGEKDYDPVAYAPIGAMATPYAGEVAQELYIGNAELAADEKDDADREETPLD